MGNTIKGIEVIAYKGMKSDMSCRDFKYEVGKTYKTDKAKLCNCGYHACLNPIDVLDYYPKNNSRYFRVKLSGDITKCGFEDTKVAATEITVLEEITDIFDEIINNTEWWKNDNVIDLLRWSDGFARVQRGDGLWNFIDKQGNYLSDEWFNWADNFYDGFARVQRVDGLWNFIDNQGNYLSDEWFNWADNFYDGFARVQRGDGLWNFIDKQGNYLSDEWFNWADNFSDGFARVKRKDKWNFIDKQGNYLFDEWFYWADNFYDGFAEVKRANGEWCNMDKTGTLIKFKDMEGKIKQVEEIDTLKELNKNLISENERLTKKNMKLAENYKAANKKSSELKKALSEIKGFENAEKLCMELQRLKKQNTSLSKENEKLIAARKFELKQIEEQRKTISAAEKIIDGINEKLKIITISQQNMHSKCNEADENQSYIVQKYKDALAAKCIAESKRDELEKEKNSIEAEKENIKDVYRKLLSDWLNLTKRVYKANLKTRIKYLFTKDI